MPSAKILLMAMRQLVGESGSEGDGGLGEGVKSV